MRILLQRWSQTIRAKLSLVQRLCLGILIVTVSSNATAAMQEDNTASSYSQTDFETIQKTLITWLECEECTSNHLKNVVQLGPKALPFLKSALIFGPSDSRSRELALHLRQEYKKLKEYQASNPKFQIPLSETLYIETHINNFSNQYRTKSATALGQIGGPDAIGTLENSLKIALPTIVHDAVKDALKITRPAEHSDRFNTQY